MLQRTLRLAGLLLFAAAFALPAIRVAQPGPGPVTEPGWVCALFATAANGSLGHLQESNPAGGDLAASIALALSGWVNPLFPLYLALSYWPRTVTLRRVLAAIVLLGFASSWFFFLRAGFIPLIGHFLWVAGPLLAFVPEFMGRLVSPRPPQPQA